METFDIQTFAVATHNYVMFQNPETASIRVPVNLNDDKEIAIEGDDYAATKNYTFANTKVEATAYEIMHGSTYNPNTDASTTGIIETFITYLLGASYNELNMKRTIVQNTVNAVWSEPTPDLPTPGEEPIVG